ALPILAKEYIRVVNHLTNQAERDGAFPKVTTKHIDTILPSAVCNQAIRDARSVYRKTKKLGKRPMLKKPVYYINNQNFSIFDNSIAFPIVKNGKTKKTRFPAIITDRDRHILAQAKKLGLMRIVEKAGKWYAQVSVEVPRESTSTTQVMGVDLGVKC